jgi:ligand-binding SRPBCC domain-containing protein
VLDRVDAGRGFVEESTSWVQRRWRHERTLVDAAGGGTTVTDRLVVRPRVALARPVVGAIVGALFRHRHRRLRRRFGTR